MSVTVSQVLDWDPSHLTNAAQASLAVSRAIDHQATTAALKVEESVDFFVGVSGDQARLRAKADRNDTYATVDVIRAVAKEVDALAASMARDIAIIRAKKAEAERSKWHLFVAEDGTVASLKGNVQIFTENIPFGLWAVAMKNSAALELTMQIRPALDRIGTADTLGAAQIARLLEQLSDAAKRGVVALPTDPDLARILKQYQVSPSKGAILWPPDGLLRQLAAFGVQVDQALLTGDEYAKMLDLLAARGPVGLAEHYRLTELAKNTAAQQFPGSTHDGHGDAFRHAYWNALMTQKFGEQWTREFATGHEKGGGTNPHREAMDLYNNELGRKVALANPNASPKELEDLVKKEIAEGRAVVIRAKGVDGQPVTPHLEWSNRAKEHETGSPSHTGVPLPAGST